MNPTIRRYGLRYGGLYTYKSIHLHVLEDEIGLRLINPGKEWRQPVT
ncbi:hypothetical protein [Sporosarcina ureilytica]|nr:hypothetical protein [Sporosarcina ureilytica]